MTAPAIELRLSDEQLNLLAEMVLARLLPLMERVTAPARVVRYLTVAEYAAERRCSQDSVYKAVEAGKLEARRNGRSIAIPSTELDKDFGEVAA